MRAVDDVTTDAPYQMSTTQQLSGIYAALSSLYPPTLPVFYSPFHIDPQSEFFWKSR